MNVRSFMFPRTTLNLVSCATCWEYEADSRALLPNWDYWMPLFDVDEQPICLPRGEEAYRRARVSSRA